MRRWGYFADVPLVLQPEGDLGELELRELGDRMVVLACEGRCRQVLDLSGVTHLHYRHGYVQFAAKRDLLRSGAGDLFLAAPSKYIRECLTIGRRHGDRYDLPLIFSTTAAACAAFEDP